MIKKFFPLDKNYLLEQAQFQYRVELLTALVENAKAAFEQKVNPLGLVDSFAAKIRNTQPKSLTPLFGLYDTLAAVYRFKFGNNQLEFLWDGADHLNHYQANWSDQFIAWTMKFCQHDLFIQAVLDLTVFAPDNANPQMLENRMNHFISKHLDVKFHKTKGIQAA